MLSLNLIHNRHERLGTSFSIWNVPARLLCEMSGSWKSSCISCITSECRGWKPDSRDTKHDGTKLEAAIIVRRAQCFLSAAVKAKGQLSIVFAAIDARTQLHLVLSSLERNCASDGGLGDAKGGNDSVVPELS
jgi:hypothetical protein